MKKLTVAVGRGAPGVTDIGLSGSEKFYRFPFERSVSGAGQKWNELEWSSEWDSSKTAERGRRVVEVVSRQLAAPSVANTICPQTINRTNVHSTSWWRTSYRWLFLTFWAATPHYLSSFYKNRLLLWLPFNWSGHAILSTLRIIDNHCCIYQNFIPTSRIFKIFYVKCEVYVIFVKKSPPFSVVAATKVVSIDSLSTLVCELPIQLWSHKAKIRSLLLLVVP